MACPTIKILAWKIFFAKFTRNWHIQWRYNGVGRVDKAQGAPERRGPQVPNKKIKKNYK